MLNTKRWGQNLQKTNLAYASNISRVFSVLQNKIFGFPDTIQKHHSQFPFCSLWSLAEKNKEHGNISDAILDTFDAR